MTATQLPGAPANPGPDLAAAEAVRRYRHPFRFFTLATGIPWLLWLLAGQLSRQAQPTSTSQVLVAVLGLAGLFAPMAVAAALVMRDPVLRRDTTRRLFSLRGGSPMLWLLTVGLLPATLMLGTAISLWFGYSPHQFALRGGFTFTSTVLPPWLVVGLAPVVEELAWHGYGTDALASRWSVWRSTMVFAVIWALWHLPLAGIRGYYQAQVVADGWLASANFLLSMFPFMVVMNWLYYRCGRNIWIAVLFHLSANYGNEIFCTHPDTKAFQTLVLAVIAGWLVWHDRALFFTRPSQNRGTRAR